MLCSYHDITGKLGPPNWWDEHGCPRYCEFTHRHCADIYHKQAALVEIACQCCNNRMLVAFTWGFHDQMRGNPDLKERIKDGSLHYGDPPCSECAAGSTMNCLDIRVVEFWSEEGGETEERNGLRVYTKMPEITRLPEFEIDLPDTNWKEPE